MIKIKLKGDKMIIKQLQTILNTFSESGELESTCTIDRYTIQPDSGKLLRNIKTGETTAYAVCVNKKKKLDNYIEIDDPKALHEELLETL